MSESPYKLIRIHGRAAARPGAGAGPTTPARSCSSSIRRARAALRPSTPASKRSNQRYRERGLVVLGFPCNQFGAQEPGSADAIASFCEKNYGVSFPLFAKIDVNGEKAHPLYRHLKKSAPGVLGSEAIKWNFTKFLVNRDGEVIARYAPATTPESDCQGHRRFALNPCRAPARARHPRLGGYLPGSSSTVCPVRAASKTAWVATSVCKASRPGNLGLLFTADRRAEMAGAAAPADRRAARRCVRATRGSPSPCARLHSGRVRVSAR